MHRTTAAALTEHDGRRRATRAPAPRRRSTASTVAGKTGTAQTEPTARRRTRGSSPSRRPSAPRYAVAVIVEHGGNFGSEATGGAVAAPIAQATMLQNLLATNP